MFPREEMVTHMLHRGEKWLLFERRGKYDSGALGVILPLGAERAHMKPWQLGDPPAYSTQGTPWPCHSFPHSLARDAAQLWSQAKSGKVWEVHENINRLPPMSTGNAMRKLP